MSTAEQTEFTARAERHRRELQVHCYRMLGSLEESEDLVQETFLRAWRRRETYAGRSTFRAWLYKIATNACLDALARRPREAAGGEVAWLQPYPDQLLESVPASEGDEPEAAVVEHETIELAFMVAVQHLPPRPRAVLIVRDILGWSAKDTAALLETSVASVNSALQRARAGMKEHLPAHRGEWAAAGSAEERELVQRYVDASERADTAALKATLAADLRFSMPPEPGLYEGRDEVFGYWVTGGFGTPEFGEIRCLVTRANGQPAVANYVRAPGAADFAPMALDVLRIEDGEVAEIVTFDGAKAFPWFGLPVKL